MFKLLQIKYAALVFRFLTAIQHKIKKQSANFPFFVVFTHRRCGFAIA